MSAAGAALLVGSWALLVQVACIPQVELKPENQAATSGAGGDGSTGTGVGGDGGDGDLCASAPSDVPPDVAAWLATQGGGFCNTTKNSYVNLCGQINQCGPVACCTDTSILKPYPDGLSIDIGLHWGGQNGGTLLVLGAEDPDGERLVMSLEIDGTLTVLGPNPGETLCSVVPLGPHLVSYRVSAGRRSLFIDGVLVGAQETPAVAVKLAPGPNGDPGAVLGHSATKQGSGAYAGQWLRFAPFLFHLREGVDSFDTFSLADATTLDEGRSVRLFGQESQDATTWKSLVAGAKDAIVIESRWEENIDANCL